MVGWSAQTQESVQNSHVQTEYETVTYFLSMNKHGQMVSLALWKYPERLRTSWGCADMVKWSARLDESVQNSHVPTKEMQTRSNGQLDFMTVSGMVTHILRMRKHGQMVSPTSGKCPEHSHTDCGCTDMVKWSAQLHESVQNGHAHTKYENMVKWSVVVHESIQHCHVHTVNPQAWSGKQLDFMKVSRTVTYILSKSRHGRIVSSSSWKCPEL